MSSLRDYFIVHSLDCQGDSPSEGKGGKVKDWMDLSIQQERGRFKSKWKSIFESCLLIHDWCFAAK